VIVKVWLPPWATLTLPLGLIEPFAPAEAASVKLETLLLEDTSSEYALRRPL
jgi:hypothetical protein